MSLFFSTKGENGTGLGLATVYGIVKQHQGHIWVYSEPDKGSTFKIYLPVAAAQKLKDKKTAASTVELTGLETILLAEDNRMVRNLGKTVLEQRGYKVLAAKNGHEALEIAITYKEPIHLLLTDVVMPELNGKQLYQKISAYYPEIKVIFMSGYTDNVIAYHGILDKGVRFIQKPFSVKSLLLKIA